jgi:hypothetical protein
VLRQLRARTYGGDADDGPSVRGARARTEALRRGLGASRGGMRVGARVTSGQST